MSQKKDQEKSAKAAKLLGNIDPNIVQASNKKKSIEGDLGTSTTDADFKDNQTKPADKKPLFPVLARFVGSKLLSGRAKIDQREYSRNLNSTGALEVNANPLTIQTRDGAQISALELGDPHIDRCIIVFQGKDGNFQSFEGLQKLIQLSKDTGARIIAFNYRDKPESHDSFIYDAAAVARYALSDIPAKNITFYGESMGGAVAAETAAKLKTEENIEVNAFIARAPKSLAYAGKLMDLGKLLENDPLAQTPEKKEFKKLEKVFANIQKIQAITPRVLMRNVLSNLFGGDFEAQSAVNKLNKENVVCLRVEDDPMITQMATAGHDFNTTVVCSTNAQDKHNASLSTLEVKSGVPQSSRSQESQEKVTAMDLLQNLANPGYKLQNVAASAPIARKA